MKLNLLPTYVSKEKQGRFAIVGAFLFAAVGLAGMFFLIKTSREEVQAAQQRINDAKPDAERAVLYSKAADTVMNDARGLLLNMSLAEAMNNHSKAYPDLFDTVKQYIPSFFRISSLNAIPHGPDSATVTMTGYLHTFQEYADLMVALLRIPGATAVSRSGFQLDDPLVPNLVEQDQTGRIIKRGEPRIPDDPMDRLDLQIANAELTGYQAAGGFGTTGALPKVRGAMPNQSTVVVAVVLNGPQYNLTTPDPRGTLASSAGLWGGSPSTTPATSATTPPSTTPPATKTPPPPTPPAKGPNRKNPGADQEEDR